MLALALGAALVALAPAAYADDHFLPSSQPYGRTANIESPDPPYGFKPLCGNHGEYTPDFDSWYDGSTQDFFVRTHTANDDVEEAGFLVQDGNDVKGVAVGTVHVDDSGIVTVSASKSDIQALGELGNMHVVLEGSGRRISSDGIYSTTANPSDPENTRNIHYYNEDGLTYKGDTIRMTVDVGSQAASSFKAHPTIDGVWVPKQDTFQLARESKCELGQLEDVIVIGSAPVAVGDVIDIELTEGDPAPTIRLSDYFVDLQGDSVRYSLHQVDAIREYGVDAEVKSGNLKFIFDGTLLNPDIKNEDVFMPRTCFGIEPGDLYGNIGERVEACMAIEGVDDPFVLGEYTWNPWIIREDEDDGHVKLGLPSVPFRGAIDLLSYAFYEPDREPITYTFDYRGDSGRPPVMEYYVDGNTLHTKQVEHAHTGGQTHVLTITGSDGGSSASWRVNMMVKPEPDVPEQNINEITVNEGGTVDLDAALYYYHPDADYAGEGSYETVGVTGLRHTDALNTDDYALALDPHNEANFTAVLTASYLGAVPETPDEADIEVFVIIEPVGDSPQFGLPTEAVLTRDLAAGHTVDVYDPDSDDESRPIHCTLASGTMPAGLALNQDCTITGTPVVLGTSVIEIAADTQGDEATNGGSNGATTAQYTIAVQESVPPAVRDAVENPRPVTAANEDELLPVEIDLSAVFSDPEGDDLGFRASPPTGSLDSVNYVIDNGTDTITIMGVPDGHTGMGTETIEVTANDGTSDSVAPYLITFDIEPVNDTPTVSAASHPPITGNEDGWEQVVIDLSGIFSDVDDTGFTYTATSNPVMPRSSTYLVDSPGETITITPRTNGHTGYGSTEIITVKGTSDDESLTYTITLDIEPVPDAPVATPPAKSIFEDEDDWEGVDVDLNAIFSDGDGTPFTYAASSVPQTPESATYRLDLVHHTITVTPREHGHTGEGTETIVVTGISGGEAATYAIILDIEPVNDVPVANPPTRIISGNEDDWDAVEIDLNGIFSDIDGTDFAYVAASSPLKPKSATYALDADGGVLTIVPIEHGNTGLGATETVTVEGTSGDDMVSYTIILDIEPVPDRPGASPASHPIITGNEDDWDGVVIDLNGIFFDHDGTEFSYVGTPDPRALESATYDVDSAAGTVTITPTSDGHTGLGTTETITITGTSGGESVEYPITLEIAPVPDMPLVSSASSPPVIADEDDWDGVVIDLNGIFSDPDGTPFTYVVTSVPQTLESAMHELDPANEIFTITPIAHGHTGGGMETITITGTSGGESVTHEITLDIEPVPDAPVANPPTMMIAGNEDDWDEVAVDLSAIFSDGDGTEFTYGITTHPAMLRAATYVFDSSEGTITITPMENGNTRNAGMDTITVTGTSGGQTATYIITLDIDPTPDAPAVNPASRTITGTEDVWDVVEIDLSGIFSDADGTPFSYSYESNPPGLVSATFTVDSPGELVTITPEANGHTGLGTTETITIIGVSGSDRVTYTITLDIEPADDLPVVSSTQTIIAGDEDVVQVDDIDLSGIFSDADDAIEYSASPASGDPALTFVTYTLGETPGEGPGYLALTRIDHAHTGGTGSGPGTAAQSQSIVITGTGGGHAVTHEVRFNIKSIGDDPVFAGSSDLAFVTGSAASHTIRSFDPDQEDASLPIHCTVPASTADPLPDGLILDPITCTITGTPTTPTVTPAMVTVSADTQGDTAINGGSNGATTRIYSVTVAANQSPTLTTAGQEGLDVTGNEDEFTVNPVDLSTIFADTDTMILEYLGDPESDDLGIATYTITNNMLTITRVDDANTAGGIMTLDITATDGFTVSSPYTITFEIAAVDDGPVASPSAHPDITGNEDLWTAPAIDLAGIFTDVDSAITYTASPSSDGLGIANYTLDPATGALAFVREDDAHTGTATETLTVTGTSGLLSDEYAITFDIEPINDAPAFVGGATHAEVTGTEDAWGPITIDLTGVFEDTDDDSLTYTVTDTGLTVATAVADDDENTLTLTRIAGTHTGGTPETLTVTASDGRATSPTYTVPINIQSAASANTAPALADGYASPFDVTEDEDDWTIADIDMDDVFSDPDGEALTYTVSPASGHSSLTVITYVVDPETNVVSFTEVPHAHTGSSVETLRITATDGFVQSAHYDIRFDIAPVDDLPVASPATLPITENEDGWTAVTSDLDEIFTDPDHTLSYSVLPASASLDSADWELDGTTNVLTISPVPDGNTGTSTETITVTATGGGQTATYMITLDIEPVADAPAAFPATLVIMENEDDWNEVEIDLSNIFSDADGTRFTYSAALMPVRFESATYLLDSPHETLTIIPLVDGHTGLGTTEIITITGTSGGETATYTITLDIEPVTDAPEADPATRYIAEDEDDWTEVEIDLSGIFSDGDGTEFTYSATSSPATLASATYALDSPGETLTVMPIHDGNTGSTTETITVTGTSGGQTATYAVTLDIASVDDAPRFSGSADLSFVKDEAASRAITVEDPDAEDAARAVHCTVDAGTADPLPAGLVLGTTTCTITGTPTTVTTTPAQVTISADTQGDSAGASTRVYSISVAANEPPEVRDSAANPRPTTTANEDELATFTIDLAAIFSDSEGDDLGFRGSPRTLDLDSVNYTISNATDTITITAAPDGNTGAGTERLEITAHDGTSGSAAPYVIPFDIEPVDDAPVASPAALSIAEDEDGWAARTIEVSDIITDVDGHIAYSAAPEYLESATYALGAASGTLDITPREHGNTDSTAEELTITGTSGGKAATYTITLDIEPVNDPARPRGPIDLTEDTTTAYGTDELIIDDDYGDVAICDPAHASTYLVAPASNTFSGTGWSAVLSSDLCTLRFTPGEDVEGTLQVELSFGPPSTPGDASDDDTVAFTANVEPRGDAPKFRGDDSLSFVRSTAISGAAVDAYDPDAADASRPVGCLVAGSSADQLPAGVTLNPDCTFSGTPAAATPAPHLVTISADTDGDAADGGSNGASTRVYSISVAASDPPAVRDSVTNPREPISADEDGLAATTIYLAAVFSDPEGEALTFTGSPDKYGLDSVNYTINNALGTVTITAAPDGNTGTGTERLEITAHDGSSDSAAPYVIVFDIEPVDDPLVRYAGATSIPAGEGQSLDLDASRYIRDPDTDRGPGPGSTSTVSVTGYRAGDAYDPATQMLHLHPNLEDDFTITLAATPAGTPADPSDDAEFSFLVEVDPLGDAPVFSGPAELSFTTGGTSSREISVADPDPGDAALPIHCAVSGITADQLPDGLSLGAPACTVTGSATAATTTPARVNITADTQGDSVPAAGGTAGASWRVYSISVADSEPPAVRDSVENPRPAISADEDGLPETVIDLAAIFADPEGDDLTFTGSPGTSGLGSVNYAINNATDTITITAAPDGNTGAGTERLEITAHDGTSVSAAPYVITFDIEPVGDAPSASPAASTIAGDEDYWNEVEIDLSGIFSDADGTDFEYAAASNPPAPESATYALDSPGGMITITPRPGAHTGTGTETITVTGTSGGEAATYTITLDIEPVDDALGKTPLWDPDVFLVRGNSYSFDIRDYVHDDEDDYGSHAIEVWWGHDNSTVDPSLYSLDGSLISFYVPEDPQHPGNFDFDLHPLYVWIREGAHEPLVFRVDVSITGPPTLPDGGTGVPSMPDPVTDHGPGDAGDKVRGIHSILEVIVTSDLLNSGPNPQYTVSTYDSATELAGGAHSVPLGRGDPGIQQLTAGDIGQRGRGDPGIERPTAGDIGRSVGFLPGAVEIGVNDDFVCPCNVTMVYNYTVMYQLGIGSVQDALKRLHILHFEDGRWEALETMRHDIGDFEAGPYDTDGANVIAAMAYSFSPFALGVLDRTGPDAHESGSGEWKRKPTFGLSWETGAQLVSGGFAFNGHSLDVTDNWHTEFERTSAIIGEENAVTAKVHAPDGLAMFSLALGVPRIGMQHEAEAEIIVDLERDYGADAGFAVRSVEHRQPAPLLDEGTTVVSLSAVPCGATGAECVEVRVEFRAMAPLKHEALAVSAVDGNRRITTTYINGGVGFEGESLLAPATAELFSKETSQGEGHTIRLVQPDRRYNAWYDADGNLWELNPHGTWIQLERQAPPARDDPDAGVMTRLHSAFDGMVHGEYLRALESWDAGSATGAPGPTFSYGTADRAEGRMERLASLLDSEGERAMRAMIHEHGPPNLGDIHMHRTGDAITVAGMLRHDPGLPLELRLYRAGSVETVAIPVAADGSFGHVVPTGGDVAYAYLIHGDAVLGTVR